MRPEIRYWDKMLPHQAEHSNLYRRDAFMQDLFDVIARSSGIGDPKAEFVLEESDMFSVEEMASNPVAMRFLRFLIKVAGVKRVLEIGTFIGFSALSFAKALPDDGEVVTIEKFDKFAFRRKLGVSRQIALRKVGAKLGQCAATMAELLFHAFSRSYQSPRRCSPRFRNSSLAEIRQFVD